jgi:hypothetical protein
LGCLHLRCKKVLDFWSLQREMKMTGTLMGFINVAAARTGPIQRAESINRAGTVPPPEL